jgi:hypothetical protein
MDEYEYNGAVITETLDGYYEIEGVEFPTLDEAIEWWDEQNDAYESTPPKIHKYVIFYIDRVTDEAYEVCIEATSYKEAEKILRREYDVYAVTDWYMVEE